MHDSTVTGVEAFPTKVKREESYMEISGKRETAKGATSVGDITDLYFKWSGLNELVSESILPFALCAMSMWRTPSGL